MKCEKCLHSDSEGFCEVLNLYNPTILCNSFESINDSEKEYKIGCKLVVKNEMRYFDIIEISNIYNSIIINGGTLYEGKSLQFNDIRMVTKDYILGIFKEIEGVDIYEYINKQKTR